ncbi:uncharacterized protein [Epargyreus clarus]|uniref:uncharacterized protein isoform X2 n=1 Tax=Epargyreus clarus TaxID=520877 RepID=UPI003C2ED14E
MNVILLYTEAFVFYEKYWKMSSFLCFICHSTVNAEISDETREKYREVVGMNLCLDSQLCHICCHVLNKLASFRCVCLKRSLEYPVLFSEKGTINLQRNNMEVLTICSDISCTQYQYNNAYQFSNYVQDDRSNDAYNDDHEYVALEDNFNDYNSLNMQYQVKKEDDDVIFDTNNEPDQKDLFCDTDALNCNETCNDINDLNYNDEINEVDGYNDNVDDFNDANDINDENNRVDDNNDNVDDFNNENDMKDIKIDKKDKKRHKKKKEDNVIFLTIEEQKAELEARRKEKKYVEAEFKCYNCAMSFLFKDTYQAHMMRHEESNGEYKCTICTLRFASPAVLRAHAATHARRCGCGARLRRCGCGSARAPPQRAACHLCGHLLKDANGLQQHLRRMHKSKMSNRLHPCTVCGENFPSQATMRTHMILECPICAKICPTQRALNLHMQAIHSNTKDHACPHCTARYSTRPSLLRHIATHTQKPQLKIAVCHLCGSRFKSKSKLNRHLKNVCEKEKLEEQLDSLYG